MKTTYIVVGSGIGVLLLCLLLILLATLHVFPEKKQNSPPVISAECAAAWPPAPTAAYVNSLCVNYQDSSCKPTDLPAVPAACQ